MAKSNRTAKITFNAETGKFNDAIKKSNDELGKLSAELKLNATQMKGTGASVEALEEKHGLLEKQLKASQDKTEALTQKLNSAKSIFGENSSEVIKLERQLANAQNAEEKLKQAINACNNEIEEQKVVANRTETATEQLTSKMENQQTELTQLKKKYADLVIEGKETSQEAENLAREIEDLSNELKQSKNAFDDASDKADKLDKSLQDAGDSAENSGGGFTVAKGAIADLASEAVQFGIEKVSEFVGWLKELPEATRELRQDFATLDTSFEEQGFTVQQAEETWKGLYRVFGEDDRAVEAANLISKMSNNQEDLNKWVTITQGVWGSYQDSLPVEALAESSNESAKVGKTLPTINRGIKREG